MPAGAQTDKSQSDKGQAAAPARDAPKDWQVILGLHQEALVQQASRFKSMDTAEGDTRGYGLARKVAEIGQEHIVLPAHCQSDVQ